ncbi:MAG: prepilin-type N-terminal cleavage/methylation domain-containing protein [Gaiellaceae bacterium]
MKVRARLRSEDGFGLIELLMAMVLLNIGILAIVASFQSGAVALRRASHVSTASALADQQMEGYRALLYAQIGFDTSQIGGLDNTYKCDTVLGASCPNTVTTCSSAPCADDTVPVLACGAANTCVPKRTVSGSSSPDAYPYRIDSYIVYKTQTSGRQLKQITVVVRDGRTPAKTLARLTSTFDQTVSS